MRAFVQMKEARKKRCVFIYLFCTWPPVVTAWAAIQTGSGYKVAEASRMARQQLE